MGNDFKSRSHSKPACYRVVCILVIYIVFLKMFTACTNGPTKFEEQKGFRIEYSGQTRFGMCLVSHNLVISWQIRISLENYCTYVNTFCISNVWVIYRSSQGKLYCVGFLLFCTSKSSHSSCIIWLLYVSITEVKVVVIFSKNARQ